MTIHYYKRLVFSFLALVSILSTNHISAQIPSTCAKIEGILVAACGTPEGQNEMLRFQIGANPMNTANLSIRWATTAVPWSGVIQNAGTAAKVDSINHQIRGCGWVLEPTGGVLPAGAQVIIVTSYAMISSYNSFANLQDTVYMLFHNSTNGTGHFKNYQGSCGTTCNRTTILTFSGAGGCVDSAIYRIDSLRTTSGAYGSASGATVNFNLNGTKTYFNDGCQAPFLIPNIYANADTPTVHSVSVAYCTAATVIKLKGKYDGSLRSYHWSGGHGTFSQPDSLATNYTLSPLDVSPLRFVFSGRFSCPDSIYDTILVNILPAPTHISAAAICLGGSYQQGSHTYTTAGTYTDTLTSVGGCDSVVTIHLSVGNPVYDTVRPVGCGNGVIYRGHTYTTSVIFADTFRALQGCDSLYRTVNITVSSATSSTQSFTLCPGQRVAVGAHTYTVSGTYIDTLAGGNSAGCDSIVTTILSIPALQYQNPTLTGCTQVVYKGVTYTTSTTVLDTLRNIAGCDSVYLSVDIILNGTINTSQTLVVCAQQSVTVGTHTYTATGHYIDTIVIGAGCDSIITTDLTVITPRIGAPVNISGTCVATYLGVVYSQSKQFQDTVRSTVTSCDSVYTTVTITVTPPTVSRPAKQVCIYAGQTYPVGTQNPGTTGIYYDTVRTVSGGCDSAITTVDLRVISTQNTSGTHTGCSQVTLHGHTYTTGTIVIDTLRSTLGCDSILSTDTIIIVSSGASIVSSAQLPIQSGDSTQLSISPAGSYQNVVWTPITHISNANAASPYVSPPTTTTYTVSAEDSNHCSLSASIIVSVTPTTASPMAMPTAFSPNGDGHNDIFEAILRPGAEVLLFHIYNRWGEKIYDQEGTGAGWDGTYRGVAQPMGVYTYFITVRSASGVQESRQGNVTLLR